MARVRRRRWPWVAGVVVLVLAGTGLALTLSRSPAKQVSVQQAQERAGPIGTLAPGDTRPAPGVYLYSGTGVDRLSLPAMSQAEGPGMPATVTIGGDGCWSYRVDYSTHHWQRWDYCLRGADLVQTGGQLWQLWNVGPLAITNSTTLTCSPPAMVLPARMTAGQSWTTTCGGTSTVVSGRMSNTGTYRYLGPATVQVAGHTVTAEHFLQVNNDTGSQQGTERYETWLAPGTGLPLKLAQSIEVTTGTPFGKSTYTQTGTLTLTSLRPTG